MTATELHIAEIPFESGKIRLRYSRYLSPDGAKWIRHGLFISYYESGQISSEVIYEHGVEHGLCRDYYENGRLAAEGEYWGGKEEGEWRFWDQDGNPERKAIYIGGVEQPQSI